MAVLKYEEVRSAHKYCNNPNSSIVNTHVLVGDYVFLRKRDIA